MNQTLVIPFQLPTLNQMVQQHRFTYAKLKIEYSEPVVLLAQAELVPIVEYPIMVHCHWFCANTRSDPDNIAAGGKKLLLDALQKARILSGDGWKQIIGFSDNFSKDPTRPRVEVKLESVGRSLWQAENLTRKDPSVAKAVGRSLGSERHADRADTVQ